MKPFEEQEIDATKMASGLDIPNFSLAGTGKTVTALRACQLAGVQRGLVLCPRIALSMWKDTIEDFLGATVTIVKSGGQVAPKTDFVVSTYDLAARSPDLIREFGQKGGGVRALINDESNKIKGVDAARTQFVMGARCAAGRMTGGLAENFDQIWNLAGNPIRNYCDDLYTQVAMLHADVFAGVGVKDYETFCRVFTFRKLKQFHKRQAPRMTIVSNTNVQMLHKLVYDTIGAIRRTTIAGMPEVIVRKLEYKVTLPPEVRRFFNGMTMDKVLETFNARGEDDGLSKHWRVLGLLKVPGLEEHIVDSASSSPVLVGIWHRDVGDEYEAVLKRHGLRVVQVNGSTPYKDLDGIRTAFNRGEIDVLVGQMAAMGESWNLQECSKTVIIAENHPSPSVIEQFYKRVARKGQKNTVIVDMAVADNDMDKALYQLALRKDTVTSRLHGDSETAL